MIKLASILRRRWTILLFCALLGLVGGVVSSTFAKTTTATLYTAQQVVLATGGGSPQDALTATRGAIPAAAAKKLNSTVEPNVLAQSMVVSYDSSTNALTFSTNDADKDAATARVAAFVDAFLEASNAKFQAGDRSRKEQILEDIEANTAALKAFDDANPQFTQPGFVPGTDFATIQLVQQRSALSQQALELHTSLREVEDVLAQTGPYSTLGPEPARPAPTSIIGVPTSKIVRGALGGILGLLLGAILVMIVERLNRRIDSRDELAEITDIPVLAEIGWLPEGRRGRDEEGRVALAGVWAEPYRRVRSAVHFVQQRSQTPAPTPSGEALTPDPPSVFLVTSTSPGEGKSTTSALLAMALAEVGTPTLLVGADFRKPKVDQLIGVSSSPSLQDFAKLDVNRPTVDDVVQQTHVHDLYAVASGKGTREVAGLADATTELCREGVRRGATVVLDSSPIKAANDTIDQLPVVDYVVLVVRAGVSHEKELLDTIAYLGRLDAQILGIVLIGTRTASRRAYYYYDYYSPPDTAG
ncbi:MAG: hypothetical protein K1X38_14165 [Microthrixaceae bacterium]|nr:hypothetical protein [Microthrixaceae bacterium]